MARVLRLAPWLPGSQHTASNTRQRHYQYQQQQQQQQQQRRRQVNEADQEAHTHPGETMVSQAGSEFYARCHQNNANFDTDGRKNAATRGGQRAL